MIRAQVFPSPFAVWKMKLLEGILRYWVATRMNVNCVLDAVDYVPAQQNRPLQFRSMASILDRWYTLELQKAPDYYWLQEFTVYPLFNPPSPVPTIVVNEIVANSGGFYHVVSEVTADFEYLVRMHITRC